MRLSEKVLIEKILSLDLANWSIYVETGESCCLKWSFSLTLCEIPWRFSLILPNVKISLTNFISHWLFPDSYEPCWLIDWSIVSVCFVLVSVGKFGELDTVGEIWIKVQIECKMASMLLTHWGRVTYICVGKLIIIGSDNGLSPVRRQAIIWTNAGILLIGPLGTNFSEILSRIHSFSFKKMHLKMSSAKWRVFCLGLNVLRPQSAVTCICMSALSNPMRMLITSNP